MKNTKNNPERYLKNSEIELISPGIMDRVSVAFNNKQQEMETLKLESMFESLSEVNAQREIESKQFSQLQNQADAMQDEITKLHKELSQKLDEIQELKTTLQFATSKTNNDDHLNQFKDIQFASDRRSVKRSLSTEKLLKQFNDLVDYNRLKLLPKVDLHRHLEGSLRISTLSEIARMFKMDLPSDPKLLAPMVQMIDESPDPHRFLAKFGILRKFYQSPSIIKRIAYEVVADAAMDNVKYLELHFSPQELAAQRGFPLEDVTDWVIESVHEAAEDFDIIVNLIVALVRHDPLSQAQRVAEIAMSRKEQGIVGLDLIGDEINYPANLFIDIFREAQQEGLKITIHAGEWMGAETVKQAIVDINADRIGQGVRAIEDESVLSLLRERQIPLEMSLANSEQTAAVPSIAEHPLKKMLMHGIKVTINTDNPSICCVTMTDELALAADRLKMNLMLLYSLTWNGLDAAFISESKRNRLKKYFQEQWSNIGKLDETFFVDSNKLVEKDDKIRIDPQNANKALREIYLQKPKQHYETSELKSEPDQFDTLAKLQTQSLIDILIVDDVPDNRRLLSRMLKRRGYTVKSASNGLEALEKTQKLIPSLILLDVAMPGMDGYQVCQTLKANDILSQIPIIFLSAHSEQVDKLRGFQAGGVDYVTKPFHFHEVAARVSTHIELFRQTKENEELRRREQTYFEKVNQLKNELIHTMTHDLKNPLTSIKLCTSLLQRMFKLKDGTKESRYFGKIEDDIDRMLILISNLLNLAYIETTTSGQMRQVDVDYFLHDCARKVNTILSINSVQTRIVSHAASAVRSVFDPDQISSVIEKILVEMGTRIGMGEIIEICYWTVGSEVLVSVSDQAMPDHCIPPDMDSELPLGEIDLGFSILSAIFERHGGRIWQDRHTKDYRFTLPLLVDLDENKPSTPNKQQRDRSNLLFEL